MIGAFLFVVLMLAWFLVKADIIYDDAASDEVLMVPDLADWHDGLRSAAAAGSDVQWQLAALDELSVTGYSKDAARLLEWMRSVEDAQG